MAVGTLVKEYLGAIFSYCDTTDHAETNSLLDREYSRKTFGLSFSFCKEVDEIGSGESKRYWTNVYLVRGKRVRVTSQWIEKHRPKFVTYLVAKGLASEAEALAREATPARQTRAVARTSSRVNARYRGNAIGNAQNAFIRNVLSNLGSESFSERDWVATKQYFSDRCAYCGAEGDLVIEHAIPINKEALGEHRLGNLVPSCRSCNARKGGSDFRGFLGGDAEAVARIEAYMDSRNYVPLEDNEQMNRILNMAHAEVAALAGRYVAIINELYAQDPGALNRSESPRRAGRDAELASPAEP